MGIKVCKFGGSSLANATQIRKVQAIVQSDDERRYVVPSAPGKRHDHDQKVTDLLYLCHEHAKQELPFGEVFDRVAERYNQIIADLGLDLDLSDPLKETRAAIAERVNNGQSADFAASRGEYLNGIILAKALDCEFVDAAEVIRFDDRGRLDEAKTDQLLGSWLSSVERAVIPGFYGSKADGSIKTFSRGGSDVSGALVARAVRADVYENWTDVSGLLMADPRVVDNPKTIDVLTYRELRELSYMGASVLHDEAVFPARKASIPVNIRNTNEPGHPGTIIVSGDEQPDTTPGSIAGIAGRKDFTIIAVEKAMMNAELGYGRRVLSVLEAAGVSFEHMPSGIDTLSVVVADSQLNSKLDEVLDELQRECQPDSLEVYPDMALIATVGRGMTHIPGMAARLFSALAQANINIRMIDQGSSELNIIIGVEASDFENAVQTIYDAFVH